MSPANVAGKSFPTQANGMFATNAAIGFVPIAYPTTEADTAAAASSAANAPSGIWKNNNADWIVFQESYGTP